MTKSTVQRVTRHTRYLARMMAARDDKQVPAIIEESVISEALRTGVPAKLVYKPAKRKAGK